MIDDERPALPSPAVTGGRRHVSVLRVLVALLVLGACLWFFLRLDLHTTWRMLVRSNWRLLLLAAAANLVLHLGLKAVRWHALLQPHAPMSYWHTYLYTLAGNAASHALPARAGEALRATLARRHGVPLATSAGVQVVEGAIETWSLILVALPLPWVLDLPPLVRDGLRALYVTGIAGALLAIVVAVIGHRGGRLLAWLRRGASGLRSARTVGVVSLSTLLARFVDAGILLLTLHAVGLSGNLWTAFLVILAVDAALLMPTTPGGLGAFEAASVGALHLVGKDPSQSLAFGIAYHAIQQIPGMLAGAAVMLWFKPTTTEPAQ
jgi:glycosyltransferase 2 family protein